MGFKCQETFNTRLARGLGGGRRRGERRRPARGRARTVSCHGASEGRDETCPFSTRGGTRCVQSVRGGAPAVGRARTVSCHGASEGLLQPSARLAFRQRAYPQSQAAACGKACAAARSSHRTDACSRAAPPRRQRAGPAGSLRALAAGRAPCRAGTARGARRARPLQTQRPERRASGPAHAPAVSSAARGAGAPGAGAGPSSAEA